MSTPFYYQDDQGKYCVIYSCGEFDIILFQTDNSHLADLCLPQHQMYCDKPLRVVTFEEVRKLEFEDAQIPFAVSH